MRRTLSRAQTEVPKSNTQEQYIGVTVRCFELRLHALESRRPASNSRMESQSMKYAINKDQR
jgi:hypothetical protein